MKLDDGQTMICKCGAEMDRIERGKAGRKREHITSMLVFVCSECGQVGRGKDFLLSLSMGGA